MFTSATMPRLSFRDPLAVGVEERLGTLGAGGRRIAYFFDPILSAFRYRAINMVQSLSASPELGVSASWFTPRDLARMDAFIDRTDVLVICRVPYDAFIDRIVARAKRRNVSVLFDVDDLVFDERHVGLVLRNLELDGEDPTVWDYWRTSFARLGATLKACDRAIVTNEFLAAWVDNFAPTIKVNVIPNFLNRAQQSVSRRIFAKKVQSGFARDDRIHIGYFSGTATHGRDFGVVSRSLANLLESDRRIVVRIVGSLAVADGSSGVGDLLAKYQDRIDNLPLHDYLNLQHLIGEVEINIAPLLDNEYSQCKSELKFFEAGIVGTLTVASPTVSFRKAIRDNFNGFLAQPDEWTAKLAAALDVVERRADYQAMAQRAFQYAEQNYGWDRFADLIAATVFDR